MLERVHGVGKSYLRRVLVIAAVCLAVSALGMYPAYAEYRHNPDSFPRTEDAVGFFVCGIVPLSVFFFALWAVFRKGRAEVRIYEHGLVHAVGRQIKSCRWDEIENIFIEIGDPKYVYQIQKIGGEVIILTEAIEDVRQIAERVDRELDSLGDE